MTQPATAQRRVPPRVPWLQWYAREGRVYGQGQHKLISGPTGSGKTVLCRHVVRQDPYVVVMGTKPSNLKTGHGDESLLDYEREGYLRIDHWPPTPKDKDEFKGTGEGRFLLWPEMRRRADLRSPHVRALFLRLIDSIYEDYGWTLVVDESLWVTEPQGLDLGQPLSELAYGGRALPMTLVVLSQRSMIPRFPIIWTNVSQALTFKQGRADDISDLATLSTYEPKEVAVAIKQLQQYEFLDLPVRAQSEWAVSRVPESWA